jgi:NAD(P)H-hydrate repair Nnr-like enzyme with NAD(P)H-hydrate dehydratase domain
LIKEVTKTHNVILTPNLIEFKRICDACGVQASTDTSEEVRMLSEMKQEIGLLEIENPICAQVVEMSRLLGCIILRKGPIDIVTDGKEVV